MGLTQYLEWSQAEFGYLDNRLYPPKINGEKELFIGLPSMYFPQILFQSYPSRWPLNNESYKLITRYVKNCPLLPVKVNP